MDPNPNPSPNPNPNPDQVLLLLLEHGADPDHHTEKLGSPLMQAAGAGHIACVRALLEAGADISLQTIHQRTALDLALRHGHAARTLTLTPRTLTLTLTLTLNLPYS